MEECLTTDRGYGRAWFGNDPWYADSGRGMVVDVVENFPQLTSPFIIECLRLRQLYHGSTALSDVT